MKDCCLTTHISKYIILQIIKILTPKSIAVVLEKDKLITIKKRQTP